MRMTPELEEALLTHIRAGAEGISVPDLQADLHLSYPQACSLIEYAYGRKWIADCTEDNRFPVITEDPAKKELPIDICKRLYVDLAPSGRRVLRYIGDHFGVTRREILDGVNQSPHDSEKAIDKLVNLKLIFVHEGRYYVKIAEESIQDIENPTRRSTMSWDELFKRHNTET